MHVDVLHRRRLVVDAENHHVQHFLYRHAAAFQVVHLALERIGQEETRPRQHPGVRVAHQHRVANPLQGDGGTVREQQVTPAQHRLGPGKGAQVLVQHRDLDKAPVVLLLHRHEHPDDISEEMGPALWDAVQKHGLGQRLLLELRVQFVQVIALGDDSRHGAHLFVVSKEEYRQTPVFFTLLIERAASEIPTHVGVEGAAVEVVL